MIIIENQHGYKGSVEVHAEVPHHKAPKIIAEKIIKGVRYYIVENGKKYFADMYDRSFKCAVKLKMKGRYHKGDLIGNGAAWQ